jgi:hypothetical protein
MCKKNVKTYLYYANICKHEYEKNMTKLWCKIVLLLMLNILKDLGVLLIFIPLWDLAQGNFQGDFYVCIK